MRRRQLSHPSELPAEFNIQKYAPPEKTGYWYWVAMLEARVLRRFMALDERYKDEIQRACTFMFNDPQWPSKKWPREGPGLRREIHGTHISDFRVADFFYLNLDLEDARFDRYRQAWEATESSPLEEVTEALQVLDSPLYTAFREVGYPEMDGAYLRVDLCGSEEKIVDDFRKWVQAAQKAMGLSLPKRRVVQADFDSWTRYQVLAYLDLTLWANVNDIELTQNALGLALFPNEYDVSLAERVRKTVSPLAKSIGNEDFTDLLRAQALEAEPISPELIPGKWNSVSMTASGSWSFVPE